MSAEKKLYVSRFAITKEAIDAFDGLRLGELVFDLETGFYYCKHKNKFGIITEEELAPCLSSQCDKRKDCFKYSLANKFPEDRFIVRDLSKEVERVYDEFENYRGTHTCCSKDNRYRCFRWNEE